MIKFVTLLLLALCTPRTQQINLDLAEKVLNNSSIIRIKITRINPEGEIKHGLAGCSGTFVGENTVLTAAHCFQGSFTNVWVKPYAARSSHGFVAHVVKLDFEHDLALLALEGYQTRIYAKRARSVRLGEAVISVGSPYGLQYLLSEGIVAAQGWKDKDFKSLYLVHTGMINPGSSGGGAFNDKGELIGVNTMSYGSPFGWSGISAAVSVANIEEILK